MKKSGFKRIIGIVLILIMIMSALPSMVMADEPSYKISFAENGGVGWMQSVTNTTGQYSLPRCSFDAPSGKEFKCWSVGGVEKNPYEIITITENTLVTAVWQDITATTYTVSFDVNGGTGTMADVTNAPTTYILPESTFVAPANKQFKCWSIGPDNSEYDPGDRIKITEDTTVKAVWDSITSVKNKIYDVEATSSDLSNILTLYGLKKMPEFTITAGNPAYINASTSNLVWQKKVDGAWETDNSQLFTPGEWRISCSIRIDGTDAYNYELGNPTTLTVNGQPWQVENYGKPSVHPDYSVVWIYSPAFVIADDPNVLPPVEIPSVNIILNGYEENADVLAATVSSDDNVDVELLGILKAIDLNGDGTPDDAQPATGTFQSGEMYAISISFKAKSGYGIYNLTADKVFLDQALVDMYEGYDSGENKYTGMYILKDARKFDVAFNTNGGSNIASVKVNNGSVVNVPVAPTKAYYAFAGWYKDEALTQEYDFDTPVTSNTTLYAKWTPSAVNGKFLLTIDIDGATCESFIPSGEVDEGSTLYLNSSSMLSIVTPPSGKEFDGFEVNGVRYEDNTEYIVKSNTTVKILWKNIQNENPNPNPNPPVSDIPNPPAGSNNVMWFVIAIMLISGFVVIGFAINNKKKAYVK